MTTEQVRKAVNDLSHILSEVEPEELENKSAYIDFSEDSIHYKGIMHIKWMLTHIPCLLEHGKIEKAMRWLGFVQGALWATGIITIGEAKNQNRPE